MKLKWGKWCFLGVILILQCCSEPVKEYSFASLDRITGWDDSTSITLDFEMRSTTTPCELYLVGEVANKRAVAQDKGYPVGILLISPDSLRYTDTITLPVNVVQERNISQRFHGIKVIEWPYRKNIYNNTPGQWRMIISKAGKDEDYGNIIGLGVYCKQDKI